MDKIRAHRPQHRRQIQVLRARHLLSGGLGPRGDRGAPGQSLRAGGRRGSLRLQHHHHLRPPRRPRTTSRSRRCWRSRPSISTWWPRACAPARVWWSKPARRAKCIILRCLRATAPKRSTPILRSRPCSTCRACCPRASTASKAIKNFVKAIGKGLLKVMSKMGISTYMSYTGAQIFEAIGLSRELVDKYFTGTASNVEGIGVFEVAEESDTPAPRRRSATTRCWPMRSTPVANTHSASAAKSTCGRRTRSPSCSTRRGSQASTPTRNTRSIINDQSKRHMTLPRPVRVQVRPEQPIPLEEVEPAKEIVKRFATGAMSLGSISTEAHTTLAIAMNRIGGKSNTGEGGEDPRRYAPAKSGETLASRHRRRHNVERDFALKEGDSLRSRDQAGRLGPLRRHRRVPGRAPTRSRSRWRRAPSPARAASCPATRCPSTSAICVTRCRAWA